MGAELVIVVRSDGDRSEAVVSGEVDTSTCDELKEALSPIVGDGGHVAVHLGDVSFMDSSGINCVLRLRELAASSGGSLVVTELSSPVRQVLELSGTLDLLTGQHIED